MQISDDQALQLGKLSNTAIKIARCLACANTLLGSAEPLREIMALLHSGRFRSSHSLLLAMHWHFATLACSLCAGLPDPDKLPLQGCLTRKG